MRSIAPFIKVVTYRYLPQKIYYGDIELIKDNKQENTKEAMRILFDF
jgi:hypothetical protein